MRPLVYVLVLNYCSFDDTLACVERIRHCAYENIKLLVLDNASPDGSGDRLRGRFSTNEFIQLPINTGYAGGNNAGIQRAVSQGAQYLIVVNPDVRLPPGCIGYYVDVLENDHSIGAMNSIQVGADGASIDAKFRSGILHPLGFARARIDDDALPELFESESLFGAALVVPTRTIRRIGGFDPLFFAYGEEVDLCDRIRFHGLRLVVTSRFPVIHLRTGDANEISRSGAFLRVKGYYLAELKRHSRSMLYSALRISRELTRAMLGRHGHRFPFLFPSMNRSLALQTAAWLALNFPVIVTHRAREKKGRCYV